MEFRTLKADEIDVKVGSVTSKGYTLLLYKNARVDMAILDETVGAENWQNKFYEVCGNLYCSLGIYCNNAWIWKDDCGVESAFGDKEKGQASDARKRAGFAWGIGRELYTSPLLYVSCETFKDDRGYKIKNNDDIKVTQNLAVKEITYNSSKQITKVVIIDRRNGDVICIGKNDVSDRNIKEQERLFGGNYIFNNGKHKGISIKQVFEEDKKFLEQCLASQAVSETIKNNITAYYKEVGEIANV